MMTVGEIVWLMMMEKLCDDDSWWNCVTDDDGEIVWLMMMVKLCDWWRLVYFEKGTGEGTRRHLFHSCIFTHHTSCLHEKNERYILATGYAKCVCISECGKCVFQSGKMKVEVLPTERALLAFLLAKIHKLDPDLIVVSSLKLFTFDSHEIEIKPSYGCFCVCVCVFFLLSCKSFQILLGSSVYSYSGVGQSHQNQKGKNYLFIHHSNLVTKCMNKILYVHLCGFVRGNNYWFFVCVILRLF